REAFSVARDEQQRNAVHGRPSALFLRAPVHTRHEAVELRAAADGARHPHVAAEERRQLAAEREAETRAAHSTLQAVPHLRELGEDRPLVLRTDTDAGIGDAEENALLGHEIAPGCRRGPRRYYGRGHRDLAPLGELDRIRQKVAQDLRELALVGDERR